MTTLHQSVGIHCLVTLTKGVGTTALQTVGPFYNLVVNNGLNNIADTVFNTLTTYCHCGTSDAVVAPSNTGLGSFFAGTNNVISSVASVKGTPPYYARHVKTYRFVAGTFSGQNIREVSFSSQAGNGAIFSRALAKNPFTGAPAAAFVQANEWLDVRYEFRLYPQFVTPEGVPVDGSGNIVFNGASYAFTVRPANITDTEYWDALNARAQWRLASLAYASSYGSASVLGLVTQAPTSPSGADAIAADTLVAHVAYISGQYKRTMSMQANQDVLNASGGLRSLRFNTAMGSYQIRFEPIVVKPSGTMLNFRVNLAWANVPEGDL